MVKGDITPFPFLCMGFNSEVQLCCEEYIMVLGRDLGVEGLIIFLLDLLGILYFNISFWCPSFEHQRYHEHFHCKKNM